MLFAATGGSFAEPAERRAERRVESDSSLSLVARARRAQDLALQRLLEIRSPSGAWNTVGDMNALGAAMFVIMLRTTGLIERTGADEQEMLLVRHMINQANPDGGFYKYPGSLSSRSVTALVVLALRMAIGDVPPRDRPASWLRRNGRIDNALADKVVATIARAESFLNRGKPRTTWTFEFDHMPALASLAAHAGVEKPSLRFPFHQALLVRALCVPFHSAVLNDTISRSRMLSGAARQISAIPRNAFPALSILYQSARIRNRRSRRLPELLRTYGGFRSLQRKTRRAARSLAARILDSQEENGGWCYNVYYTMFNVMALHEAGVPLDGPAIQKALAYLRRNMHPADDGGVFLNWIDPDIWSTSCAVLAYLWAPGRSAMDAAIRPSVEFLLRWQGEDGSFAFASGSRKFPDHDSTGLVLLALSVARETAEEELQLKICRALQQGTAYLVPAQNKRGGFSVYDKSIVRCKPRPFGFLRAAMFDPPSTDVTGRILWSLARLGYGRDHEVGRKGLRFLIRNQSRSGAWWCRWWAGYIAGAYFVLPAMSELGLQYGENPFPGDKLLTKAHAATMRCIAFLLEHQNADGGWGETTRADADAEYAGVGPSTPLHTAAAVWALLRCGYPADSPEVANGIEYLLSTMTPDGRWEDNQVTFTALPRTFYYTYPIMAYVVPLNALTEFLRACDAGGTSHVE
ncbi:hypothetical protein AMJ85_04415 [candidate division BRC1 bacterium SM23_51]|nr:MAG: hypothetical protein AMJ85_04415 [candidate division BRC1 bacterium SM23_51]